MAIFFLIVLLCVLFGASTSLAGQAPSYMIYNEVLVCTEQFSPPTLTQTHLSKLLQYHYRYDVRTLREIECRRRDDQLHYCQSTTPSYYKSRLYTRQYFAKADVLIHFHCQQGGRKAVMHVLTEDTLAKKNTPTI